MLQVVVMHITSSIEKYRCSIFRVTEDEADDPSGFHIKRSIIRHPGSAVVMPIDEKGRMLLVRQFRLPAQKYLWEIPAGKIDDGENAFEAAQRELGEETGLTAKSWKELVIVLSQSRIRRREDDDLRSDGPHAGRGAQHGRRANRLPVVHAGGSRRGDSQRRDPGCKDADRLADGRPAITAILPRTPCRDR